MIEELYKITYNSEGKQQEFHHNNDRFLFKLKKHNYNPGTNSINVIMLNPSDKDFGAIGQTVKIVVDACNTIKSIKNYGEIVITNLLSHKSSKPILLNNVDNFAIKYNDYFLENEIEYSETIIVACGNIYDKKFNEKTKKILLEQLNKINLLLKKYDKIPYCFGLNSNNTPKHPMTFRYMSNCEYSLIEFPINQLIQSLS